MINKEFVLQSEQYEQRKTKFYSWLVTTLIVSGFFFIIVLYMVFLEGFDYGAIMSLYMGGLFLICLAPGVIVSYIRKRNLLKDLDTYRTYQARVRYCDQTPVRAYRYSSFMTTIEFELLDEFEENTSRIKVRYETRRQTIFLEEGQVIQVAYSKALDSLLFDKKY